MTAEKEFPSDSYYDDGALVENGVGAVNQFVRSFNEDLEHLPRLENRKIKVITGTSMEKLFTERKKVLSHKTGADIEIVGIVNQFYGDTVTVAGLLAGNDIKQQAGETNKDEIILIPADALNADDLFIDSMSLDKLKKFLSPAKVVTGYDLTECLQNLGV
jgi:NifB/MoaA-like Fe-S oxidoreductase